MCPLFKWKSKQDDPAQRDPEVEDPGDPIEESISVLSRKSDGKELAEVVTEVEQSIKEASKSSLRELRFQVAGRCPECGKTLETYIQTRICPSCGWASYVTPSSGETTVHTTSGQSIRCDQAFRVRHGDVLCVTREVVTQVVPANMLSHIEYHWSDEERDRRRLQEEREKRHLCGWCQSEVENDDKIVEYLAFGTFQHRYIFCSESCREDFKKHYPSRIHRNCYETDCESCDLCIKRYNNAHRETRAHARFIEAAGDNGSGDKGETDAPPRSTSN
jgi:hypothetical protein